MSCEKNEKIQGSSLPFASDVRYLMRFQASSLSFLPLGGKFFTQFLEHFKPDYGFF